MKHIRSTAFVARPGIPFHMPAAQDNGLPVPVDLHVDLVRFLSVYELDGQEIAWGRDFVDGIIVYRYCLNEAPVTDQVAIVRNRLLSSHHIEVPDCDDPASIDPVFRAGRVSGAAIDIFHPHYRLAGIDAGFLHNPNEERIEE